MTTMTPNKPINVEAQRVIKVVADTQGDLETLAFLSAELFQEVSRKTEEDLKAAFGNETGGLLWDESQREDCFSQVNMIDGVKMEPLDSIDWQPEQRKLARVNAMAIENNVKQLVRTFSRKDMRDKLVKEFGMFKTNDINGFKNSYERMKILYQVKNGTSLVDHLAIQEQLKDMKGEVARLQETLKTKQDTLDQYTQESKEHKAQRIQEIEDLKKQRGQLGTDKKDQERELKAKGEEEAERSQKRNEENKKRLQARIAQLQEELKIAKTTHAAEEKQLTDKYDLADKAYTEALETYDNEMRDHNKQKDIVQKEFDDANEQLRQVKEQWAERLEERRKRDELQAIIDRKKAEQDKAQLQLSKAAEWVQAHWRGRLARLEMEKARKKGKKRGKKKK